MKQKKAGNVYNLVITIRPYSGEMFLAIICSLLKQAAVLGAAALTSYMAGTAMGGALHKYAVPLTAGLSVFILLRSVLNYGEMWFAHDVAFRVIRDFRLRLFQKISDISPAYTLREKIGKLGQTLISDVEILELFLAHTFSGFVVAAVVTFIILGILLMISPVLAILLLITAGLLAAVPYSMRKRAARQGNEVREDLAETNAVMIEGVQGLREIFTLNYKERYQKKVFSHMDRLYKAQEEYGRRKGTEGMAAQILCGCFTVAVMAVSAKLVLDGKISFAMYPVVVMLSTIVLAPVTEAAAVAQELGMVFAASNRIQKVLSSIPAVCDNGTQTCTSKECGIDFENVSFSYSAGEGEALKNVNFRIRPGETVVLVGHSGAGKTTCANLLLRYWDASEGSIRINGINLRDYRMESLRKTVSAVQQDTYLFHASIRDNIRLGRPEASEDEVESAAKAANAHEFICGLPEGYDTVTGERGFSLSGGQRQRIAIARALLKDTPVVIFDEAVSSLDTENERYIQEMLKTRLSGKTVLMIAHRLSTILSADRIVMLEKGCVVDVGTHEELLERCGKYRDLINKQMAKS